jgi:hypothetical protein
MRWLLALLLHRDARHRIDESIIKRTIGREAMEHRAMLREQVRQLVPEVGDRMRFVGAKLRLRALRAKALAIPDLARRIARPHEQDRAMAAQTGAPRRQHRFRLGEPGQEVEVGPGTELVQHVAVAALLRRGGQQQEAVAERVEQTLAAATVQGGIEVDLMDADDISRAIGVDGGSKFER